MNTMDNAKLLDVMEKFAFQKYLEKLLHADTTRLTLFPVFSQTGAPNLSSAAHIIRLNDLEKLTTLNGGITHN